jgi:hypothetical protein
MFKDARHQLQFWSQECDKVIAWLAEKDLPDARRRSLIIALRSMFRLRRKWLREAETCGAMAPTELAKARREFAETGLAVCQEQAAAVMARCHSSDLSAAQLCTLVRTWVTLIQMSGRLIRDQDRASREERTVPAPTAKPRAKCDGKPHSAKDVSGHLQPDP